MRYLCFILGVITLLNFISCKENDLEYIPFAPQTYVVEGTENLGILTIPEDNKLPILCY